MRYEIVTDALVMNSGSVYLTGALNS